MNKVVVADTDALIALLNPHDAHASLSLSIVENMYEAGTEIIYPSTVIAETVTTFQRKLDRADLCRILVGKIREKVLKIEPVDDKIIHAAAAIFDSQGSKKNTFFDAVVAAVAQKYGLDTIFSFDAWYKKLGFHLALEKITS